MADREAGKTGLGCCCCLIFILSIILFAVSFDTLEPTQIGIKYNNNFLTIDEEHGAYNNGRYFLGLGLSFVKFPSHLIEADFTGRSTLRAWSREGQLINIELGFYYRLDRDKIVDIYQRYNQDYHTRMTQIAIRAIKEVTIQYEAQDYFLLRKIIGDHMSRALFKRMREEDMIVELFALRAIDIPDMFERKVVSKVVKLQEQKTANNKKTVAVLKADIEVARGTGRALVNTYIAKANAEKYKTIELAKATGNQLILDQQASSYAALMTELGLGAQDLLKFRFAQLMGTVQTTDRKVSVSLGFSAAALSVTP